MGVGGWGQRHMQVARTFTMCGIETIPRYRTDQSLKSEPK